MVTLQDVQQAQKRLKGVAMHTPLLPCLDEKSDSTVWLKPESFQPIGSFKIRGAYNRIAALPEAERANGIIAYSSGNHAQGVAYAAKRLNIPATIVMPQNAPQVKIDATRGYGANVVLYDPETQKREDVAADLMQGQKWALVPPFNHHDVIAGQGTIGLEIYEDLPEVDLVLVPVGGGGLVSGIATALKSLKPSVKVIGVEPELADDALQSMRSGKIVEYSVAQTGRTIADGTRTQSIGPLTFEQMKQYVDDIVTVSEVDIRAAIRELALKQKLVIEPSGVLPYAAWHACHNDLPHAKNVVLVLSGGNIDPALLADIVNNG